MKKMLIDAAEKESVRVAITKDSSLIDYESEKIINERIKGNIYLAKIVRVEPSLQAAFVDYGGNRHGFQPIMKYILIILRFQQLTRKSY